MLTMLFVAQVMQWNAATLIAPLWPMFYVFFGVTVIIVCNFLLKTASILICIKVPLQERKLKVC